MNKEQFLHASIPFDICMYKKGKTPLRLHCGNYNTLVDNEKRIAIVHPLSDLTKLIIHNGEKFVPIVAITNHPLSYYDDEEDALISIQNYPMQLRWWTIQKLIEWHFNLMDKNEPFIDVNTLSENPYK